MITLYHSPTTRSFRILWLLEELGIDYHVEAIDFYNEERHQSAFRKINPVGTIPVLKDGPLILTESGAIIHYLLSNYADRRFSYSDNSDEAALVNEWMYWSEGLFAVHQRIYWDHCAPPPGCILNPVPAVGIEAKRQALRYAQLLEIHLQQKSSQDTSQLNNSYVVGTQLSGADFMLCFPLFLANLEGWFDDAPNIQAYVMCFSARPAFQRAIADTLEYLHRMHSNPSPYPSFRSLEKD